MPASKRGSQCRHAFRQAGSGLFDSRHGGPCTELPTCGSG
jgi:hypothetical protein